MVDVAELPVEHGGESSCVVVDVPGCEVCVDDDRWPARRIEFVKTLPCELRVSAQDSCLIGEASRPAVQYLFDRWAECRYLVASQPSLPLIDLTDVGEVGV